MSQTTDTPPPATVKTALIMLPIIAILIIAYLAMTYTLDIKTPYAGYFFLLYWAGIRQSAPNAFLPALLGGLAGIGTGYLLFVATPLGTGALLGVVALIFLAIFIDLVRWIPMVINTSYMVFLTVAAAGPMQKEGDFIGQASALLLSAVFFGGIILGVGWIQTRRQKETISI